MNLFTVFSVFSFALGAVVASFLNVVIWRVPRGESIVSPPSHCPKCSSPIRWWQNIPVLSYLFLGGRCACCKARISVRYALVETLGGILFLAVYLHLGKDGFDFENIFRMSVWWIWISLMIAGSFIDFDHKLLPDFTTVGGMILGLMHSVLTALTGEAFPPDFTRLETYFPILVSFGGLVFGFALLYLIRFLGSKAFGREAMGMGDVFLMGAVGAMFGPVAVLLTMILSSLFGSVVGVLMMTLAKARPGGNCEIPYGPYICMGCLVWMFWGADIVGWYLGTLK